MIVDSISVCLSEVQWISHYSFVK